MAELSPLTARVISEFTSALQSFTPEQIAAAHEENRKQIALTEAEQAQRDEAVKAIDQAASEKKAIAAYSGILKGREDALLQGQDKHKQQVENFGKDKETLENYAKSLQQRATELSALEETLKNREADQRAETVRIETRKNALDVREGKIAMREAKVLTAAAAIAE